jgi:hypothetical protein
MRSRSSARVFFLSLRSLRYSGTAGTSALLYEKRTGGHSSFLASRSSIEARVISHLPHNLMVFSEDDSIRLLIVERLTDSILAVQLIE